MIEFSLGDRALVRLDDPKGRVGEPDRPVGCHGKIVGRIDPLAPVMRDDWFRLIKVVAAPTDASPPMFAMNDRIICFDGVAVHEPGAVDQDLDMAVLIPSQKPPVGHVRPHKSLSRRLPCRPLTVNCAVI